jgi:tRNA-2-methylthio-N6-dimethylallyladenosine synthase
MSGRAPDNRLVHFAPGADPGDPAAPRPGDMIATVITRAAPTYLLADEPPRRIRRTRGGDAWAARAAGAATGPAGGAGAGTGSGAGLSETGPERVLLGMPARRPGS